MKESEEIMRKVGITTFISDNYGTCLQAYALQRACSNLGLDSEILDIKRAENKKLIGLSSVVKQLMNDFPKLTLFDYIKIRKAYIRKHKKFLEFQDRYINKSSEEYRAAEGISEAKEKYDFFITGSDMVWSTEFIQYADMFFLRDIPYEKSGSYAPSFGKTNIGRAEKKKYEEYLQEIKYLSCRERTGVKLIRNLSQRDAAFVCDPTLLFTKQEWTEFLKIYDSKNNSILVNCFGALPKEFYNRTQMIKKQVRASEIRYLNIGRYDMKQELRRGMADYGPVEFVQMVNDCKFTIVNGYHGLIFALIFEKPFIVLHRKEGEHWREHEERMSDLLSYVGLESRYVYTDDDIDKIETEIDYSIVREKLGELRKESWNYLSKMLETVI